MFHESTRCTRILFYSNKHDKIKENFVILENISLLYNAQKFWKSIFRKKVLKVLKLMNEELLSTKFYIAVQYTFVISYNYQPN